MSLSAQPRIACAAAALGAGLLLLGLTPRVTRLERLDHALSARLTGTEPAEELHGSGFFDDPRHRVKLDLPAGESAPLQVIVIDDDPDGVFEASPPSPTDQAVAMANLRKRGARHVAVAFPLGWESADPISLAALRIQLDRFDSATLGFPLAYGSGSDPVAPPFLRMSLPEGRATGGIARLPVVNRLAVPDAETGGERTLAGFTRLLNEEETDGSVPLLARWNKRIVFALPLAAEIARRGLEPADVRIEPGKAIVLGEAGPWIPIDETGRLRTGAAAPPAIQASASALIGGEVPGNLGTGEDTVFLFDRRTLVPTTEIQWTDRLAAAVREIRGAPLPSAPQRFLRPDALLELAAMTALALLCGLFAGSCRRIPALLAGIALPVAIWFGLRSLVRGHALLPLPLAFLLVPTVAGLARLFLPGKRIGVSTLPESAAIGSPSVPAVETPSSEPAAGPSPAGKAAERATPPAKKAAAKKAAKQAPKKKKR